MASLSTDELEIVCAEVNRKLKSLLGSNGTEYIIRAETDRGPVYLHSDDGGSSCWTSGQRYARRYHSFAEARVHRDGAFCPDAVSVSVRRLRPAPRYYINAGAGYHITAGDWVIHTGNPHQSDATTNDFSKRHIFKTKSQAKDFLLKRYGHRDNVYNKIVRESSDRRGASH